jgi:hypothetical protein
MREIKVKVTIRCHCTFTIGTKLKKERKKTERKKEKKRKKETTPKLITSSVDRDRE